MGMSRPLWLTLLAPLVIGGCAGPEATGRGARHGDWTHWGAGLEQQLERREQWVPAAGLFLATPLFFAFDERFGRAGDQRDRVTALGDGAGLGMAALAAAAGGWEWARGDRGETLEVVAESIVATGLLTSVLKGTTGRRRPEGASRRSFPSGHASFAFNAATLLARYLEDRGDTKLGYLFYAPAAYVAYNRVEADRHYASDVAAGAFLGVFLTNWIWNAHFGETGRGREGIYGRGGAIWRVGPQVEADRLVFGLSVSF